MLNSLNLLIYHAVCDLRRTGINSVASVSWSSALLMSGSLQQNVIDATINEWRKRLWERVRVQMENTLNICCERVTRLKKSRTNKVWFTSLILTRTCSLRCIECVVWRLCVLGAVQLVMELCSHGNLRDYLRCHRPINSSCHLLTGVSSPAVTSDELMSFSCHLAAGMQHLAAINVRSTQFHLYLLNYCLSL